MKIMIINSSKKWGGNERWSVSATNGLTEKGHDVIFVYKSNIFDNKFNSTISQIKLNFLSELDIITFLKLFISIVKNKIEIIIPTKRKEYFIAGIIGKILNIPVYFRLGIVRHIPPNKIINRFIYGVLPTGIICNSKEIKKQLLHDNILASEKIHVVYNGYNFGSNHMKNMDNKIFTFACAGRLTSQKGFDILLKAVKILKTHTDKFIVKIAGDGEQFQEFSNFIKRNNLQNQVKLLGHIDDPLALFAISDAIVIPSRNEGIPNVLMEAWSLKKTVIAAKSAGIPEAIQDGYNGILVDLSPYSIVEQMLFVMNSNTEHLGDCGYITLTTKFTMKKMINNLENIFINSLSKGTKYEEIKV